MDAATQTTQDVIDIKETFRKPRTYTSNSLFQDRSNECDSPEYMGKCKTGLKYNNIIVCISKNDSYLPDAPRQDVATQTDYNENDYFEMKIEK
jgi:hypothetical protein